MSDLLSSVSQVRKSLQKKRQLRSKELSLNFAPLSSFDLSHCKTEKSLRLRPPTSEKSGSELSIRSPVPPKRFDFRDSLLSPTRLHSYKLDAATLLLSRVKRFLNKHFLVWKRNAELMKSEESRVFKRSAWRLKVNVGKVESKGKETIRNRVLAGKIVRNSQENVAKFIEKVTGSVEGAEEDEIPIIETGRDGKKGYKGSVDETYKSPKNADGKNSRTRNLNLGGRVEKLAIKQKLEKAAAEKVEAIRSPVRVDYGITETKSPKEFLLEHIGAVNVKSEPPINSSKIGQRKSNDDQADRSSKTDIKENFEDCILNIRSFINERREQRGKAGSGKSELRGHAFEKIEKIVSRKLLMAGLFAIVCVIEKDARPFFESLCKIRERNKAELMRLGFDSVLSCGKRREIKPKIVNTMLRHLRKDVNFRYSAAFSQWQLAIRYDTQKKELSALSAASIQHIILSIVNCRTKLFFSTYKLFLIKHTHITEAKRKRISKALNRINLCIRDFTFKPFMRWKNLFSHYKNKVQPIKRPISRLVRHIKTLCLNAIRPQLYVILSYSQSQQQYPKTVLAETPELYSFTSEILSEKTDLPSISEKKSQKPKAFDRKPYKALGFDNKRRFSFKYLCSALNSLGNNLAYHQNSIKKNAMIKWKVVCMGIKNVQDIKLKYKVELSRTIACGMIVKTMDMAVVSLVRLGFLKLIKY
jgi:hypothetical protein